MEKEFIVTFVHSTQMTQDDWTLINPTMKITPKTTISEIESFYRRYDKSGIMQVKILELIK